MKINSNNTENVIPIRTTVSAQVQHKARLRDFLIIDSKDNLTLSDISPGLKLSLYLDWFNNFLTVAHYARFYKIPELLANEIITEQRELLAIKEN